MAFVKMKTTTKGLFTILMTPLEGGGGRQKA